LGFLAGELKYEIIREATEIALHLFVQPAGGYAVNAGEVGIEQDALSAQNDNALGDFFRSEYDLFR